MRAIHSFWSRPGNGTYHWLTLREFLYSQVISAEQARKVYGNIHLVTDEPGAELLRSAGIQYDSVSLALEGPSPSTRWWVWGKLKAYREQIEPFVHLDGDVYLWDRLPERVEQAPILAQSFEQPETYKSFGHIYDRSREAIDKELPTLPEAWAHTADRTAINMGVFGGHRLDVIHEYADWVLSIIENPANADLAGETGKWANVFIEQQMAWAFARSHEVKVTTLLEKPDQKQKSYTHVMGNKRSVEVAERLRGRMERDYPDQIKLIDKIVASLNPARVPGPIAAVRRTALLGRKRWEELHTRSRLPVLEPLAEIAWVSKLATGLEGCGCNKHWQDYLVAHPLTVEIVTMPALYEAWAVDAHNAVNARLGRSPFTVIKENAA